MAKPEAERFVDDARKKRLISHRETFVLERANLTVNAARIAELNDLIDGIDEELARINSKPPKVP